MSCNLESTNTIRGGGGEGGTDVNRKEEIRRGNHTARTKKNSTWVVMVPGKATIGIRKGWNPKKSGVRESCSSKVMSGHAREV